MDAGIYHHHLKGKGFQLYPCSGMERSKEEWVAGMTRSGWVGTGTLGGACSML